jgi:uncharacterized peroxidase-related enzyme
MSHLEPLQRADIAGLEPVLQAAEAAMGFVPNSMLTMAHMPQLPVAFLMMTSVVFGRDLRSLMAGFADLVPEAEAVEENLPADLIQLIAFAASVAAGCRYCQAHTSHGAHKLGAQSAKLDAILDFADSPLYTELERAALELAFAAARNPNEVEERHFAALRGHFNDRQIVQIVAVVSMFGFLNRWNDTMATTLEAAPADFASQELSGVGWEAGKHG